jgi:hypothetical protein
MARRILVLQSKYRICPNTRRGERTYRVFLQSTSDSKPARSVLVINAASTIMLSMAIEAMYPGKRLIHVFLDNARYHHAKPVQQWLARSGCRIRLDFIPSYCPHLGPIERLWGLMHRHWTHNKCTLGSRISLVRY